MDYNLMLEALDFAVRTVEVDIIVKGSTQELINKHYKYKSTYKELRKGNISDNSICIKSLELYKSHLEKQNFSEEIILNALAEKTILIDNQINVLNTKTKKVAI